MRAPTKAEAPTATPSSREAVTSAPNPHGRRRQTKWMLLGAVLMCLGALGAVLLWNQAAASNTVLQLTETVYRGETIQSQHLTPVTVGRLGSVESVDSERAAEFIGRPARTDLEAGTLLPPDAIGEVELPDDQVVVGLHLVEGRAPRMVLEPGTAVLLVETMAGQEGMTNQRPTIQGIFDARVHSRVVPSADQMGIMVDVVVPRDSAEAIARLAAEGRLVMVRGD